MHKKALLFLSILLLLSALLGSSILTRGHFWGDDFAAYILQTKSILARNMDTFVTANIFTVTHSSHQIGPAAYPWGFPLLLVPAYALFGLHPLGLKLPVLATYLGFLVALYFLMRRRFSSGESLLAVSLFAFNPGLLLSIDEIISDIPFLFLSTLALLLADNYLQEEQNRRGWVLAALAGVAFYAAFFVRTQGLILLGALLLFQGIRFLTDRENRRQLLTEALIIVAAFGILWGLSGLIFPGGQTSYFALYSGFTIDTLKSNITSYMRLFENFFASIPGQPFFFSIFVLFFFVGLIARFKTDLFFLLYAILYLLVLWTWPEWQGYRFIFPLLPLFIYFAFWGFQTILEKADRRWKKAGTVILYTFLCLIAGAFLYSASMNAFSNLRSGREINGPFDPFSMDTFNFIKEETPPESIIVFFKPRAMHLFTDRNSLALTECKRMLEGDYLALSKKVGENLQIPPERIDECNLPLERVFENRRFVVYRILK